MLFAAQAATAIANARTYRDEQRARADLEELIDTSPVGVVVFEAKSGAAVSINQEARRIVGGLRMPGRSPEELLEVVTCQRADGHEVSLAVFPLAQQLVSAETVRAEEIVLPGPRWPAREDAKTHAHPFGGVEVEFLVVTMQDLAPLEDLERMRTEFREHGEPRAAGAAELDQGLDRHRVRRLADRNPMQRRFRVRPFPLFAGAFAVVILGSAAFYVFDHAAAVDAFTRLGFPTWNLGRSRVRESRSLGSVGAKAESLSHPTIPPTPAALHAPNPSPVIGYAMIPPTV